MLFHARIEMVLVVGLTMVAVMIKGLPGLVIVPVSWPNVPGSNRCVRTHSSHLSFRSMIEEFGWLIGACSQAWVAESSRILIFLQPEHTSIFRLAAYRSVSPFCILP